MGHQVILTVRSSLAAPRRACCITIVAAWAIPRALNARAHSRNVIAGLTITSGASPNCDQEAIGGVQALIPAIQECSCFAGLLSALAARILGWLRARA